MSWSFVNHTFAHTQDHGVHSGNGMGRADKRHHMAMLQDQVDVLYPAPPTAFTSYTDAVERLLPYHIYQIHESELEGQEGNSGAEAKRKQRGESRSFIQRQSAFPEALLDMSAPNEAQRKVGTDLAEIRETTELDKRINKVHERFFALRRREGTVRSPPRFPGRLLTYSTLHLFHLSSLSFNPPLMLFDKKSLWSSPSTELPKRNMTSWRMRVESGKGRRQSRKLGQRPFGMRTKQSLDLRRRHRRLQLSTLRSPLLQSQRLDLLLSILPRLLRFPNPRRSRKHQSKLQHLRPLEHQRRRTQTIASCYLDLVVDQKAEAGEVCAKLRLRTKPLPRLLNRHLKLRQRDQLRARPQPPLYPSPRRRLPTSPARLPRQHPNLHQALLQPLRPPNKAPYQ